MNGKLAAFALLTFISTKPAVGQSVRPKQEVQTYMGRKVIIAAPKNDARGFPIGSASICVETVPQRQCDTAPKAFTNNPVVSKVQLTNDKLALLFSAESVGTSGWGHHFALLELSESGNSLSELFMSDITLSNQGQHRFWTVPEVSDAKVFVTAEFEWGPNEAHYSRHRYKISAYVMEKSDAALGAPVYFLEDSYLTVKKYDAEADMDILAAERPEILARLARVKAARQKQEPAVPGKK